jgi:hypothetical protein
MISSTTLVLVDKGVSKNAHIRISIPFLVFLQSATQFRVCHLLQSGCYVISLKHRSIVKAQSGRFCDSLAPVLGRTSERHTISTYKNPRNCQYLLQHCSPPLFRLRLFSESSVCSTRKTRISRAAILFACTSFAFYQYMISAGIEVDGPSPVKASRTLFQDDMTVYIKCLRTTSVYARIIYVSPQVLVFC